MSNSRIYTTLVNTGPTRSVEYIQANGGRFRAGQVVTTSGLIENTLVLAYSAHALNQFLEDQQNGLVSVAYTISGASTFSGTPGSVLFIDSGGNIAEDNTSFYWDDIDTRLGIGTNLPLEALDVVGLVRSQGHDIVASPNTHLKTLSLQEDVTVLSAAYTDSTIQMPAGAFILAVTARVTAAVPSLERGVPTPRGGGGGQTISIGVPSNPAYFISALPATLGSKDTSWNNTNQQPFVQPINQTLRITPNTVPSTPTGVVELTIFYQIAVLA